MATLQATPAAYTFAGLSSFALSPSSGCSRRQPGTARTRTNARLCRNASTIIRGSQNSQLTVSKLPPSSIGFLSSSITETRLQGAQMSILNLGKGGAMGATCNLPASPETLRWIFVAAATVLLFIKSTGIPKHFLVPLLALQLPHEVLSWFKGDYGLWTAFLSLGVKLFYGIPGELELPLYLLLVVITAPFRLTQFRGGLPAAIATLVLAAYLAYRHYQYSGTIQGAFQTDKVFASIAIVVLLVIPTVFLANGVYK